MAIKTVANKLIGRAEEIARLSQIGALKQASIAVVHGRRRVGKTTLIEHVFQNRKMIKIEGVEGGSKARQIETALIMLAHHVKDPAIAQLKFSRWLDYFDYLSRFIANGVHTLYLEELQWLASYDDELISDFKIVWDNKLQKNPNLVVVLCGSSPSFMVNKVVRSKALYGRSQHEIHVEPFSLKETIEYFGAGFSLNAVMDGYLSVGGIPEYLSYLRPSKSLYLDLCAQSFRKTGYFFNECERVFVSSLAKNSHYRKIIEHLAKTRFSTRQEIADKLAIAPGGTLSTLLNDLQMSGFVHSYVPYDKGSSSKVVRYEIADYYLQFYYRFIAPNTKKIEQNMFATTPAQALNTSAYHQWLGYSFERWCRHYHIVIAKILGFSGVDYSVGPYFSASTPENFQIDLLFSRADKVLTVCEIKYTKMPTATAVIKEFERKLELLKAPSRYSIQKVLISAAGADGALRNAGYFDAIIDLKALVS